jgi:hypothetical protein
MISEETVDKIHSFVNGFKYDLSEFYESYDGIGICLSCAETQDGCEPDAEEYTCNTCGEDSVMGMELAILHSY